ncbi:MAG TPA: ABC transporter permease [Candidatus Acidoferrum sp.]|jgi:putative ABC transport system permease protein
MKPRNSVEWFRTSVSRIIGIFAKRTRDAELDAELHAHLDALTEKYIQRGMSADEARHAARREFGGIEQIKQEYRESSRLPIVEVLLQDLRYALRALRKNPGFSAVAILTLALGIGTNTAIFSIVNAVLLRPLPFPHSDRIVEIYSTLPSAGVTKNGISYLNFNDFQAQSRSFEAIGAFHDTDITLTGSGEPEIIPGAAVTSGLFSVLGVQPIAGRSMSATDDQPGAAPVVLISERLWRKRFGADKNIIGKQIKLDRRSFSVAGILPKDFQFPFQQPPIDLWLPVQQDTQFKDLLPRRGGHYLSVVARIKPGVAAQQAQAELESIQANLIKQYPADNVGWGVRLTPLQHEIVGNVQVELLVLLSAVALVLLIACVNVANLLLTRATARSRELAVRAALGAGKRRIVRQLLTESLLLGVIGGALGALTAWWAVDAFAKFLPDDLPRIHAIQVDVWVLSFAVLLSLVVSLLFGLAPALHATSTNLVDSLKEGTRGSSDGGSRRRMRGILIASEVALAVILLAGAGLLLHSFEELQTVSPGFRAGGVLTASAALPQSQYAKGEDWARFYGQALERVKSLPGVIDAAVVAPVPMSGGRINIAFAIDGKPRAPEDRVSAEYCTVSAGFFDVLKIPLLRGRTFNEHDAATARKVAIISESFAQRYFSDENPIGQHMSFGFPEQASREIVGIVGDVKRASLDDPPEPTMYVPYEQGPMWFMTFAVRTAGSLSALESPLREQIQETDKNLPVVDVQPMTEYLHDSVAQPRFRTFLVGLFGLVALILAAVGIYGVISYTVAQRTQEIGLRMALGAAPSQVLSLVVRQGMKVVLLGLVPGLIFSFALTRFFESLLFGITTSDPLTYAGTIAILIGVSLLACYIPARRAMRVDPMIALRYE